MPAAMAVRAEASGVRRASTDPITLLVLSVLAGAFISFGAIFATTVQRRRLADLPYGIVRLLIGLVFSTGSSWSSLEGQNCSRETIYRHGLGERQGDDARASFQLGPSSPAILSARSLTAALMFYTTQYTFGGGSVGLAA